MSFRSRNSILLVTLLILHSVFLISPIVYSLGFRGAIVIPVTMILFFIVVLVHGRKCPTWVLLFLVASLTTSLITGLFWESWRAGLLPAYFGVSLLTAAVATESELRKVVQVGSALLLLFLVGGWIAVALAFAGVPPLDTVSGLHDRVLYVYFTTLTPVVIGDFIRPAGIYDEPGALSFVVCIFAYLRHLMGMDRRFTWALLILGFVTFSLAHLIYVVFHFLAERRVLVAWTYMAVVLTASIWALSALGIWETFDARLVARLSISSESGKIVEGDNRSENFFDAAELLVVGDPSILPFGVDISCLEGSPLCTQKHPGLGFTPLSPVVNFGLLISWPYYLFLAFTFGVGALRRSWWPLLAVGLLFMQRPNLLSAGYAMLGAMVLITAIRWSLLNEGLAQLFGRNSRNDFKARQSSSIAALNVSALTQ